MSPDKLLIDCPVKGYKRSWKYGCSKCKHKKFVKDGKCNYKTAAQKALEARHDTNG